MIQIPKHKKKEATFKFIEKERKQIYHRKK